MLIRTIVNLLFFIFFAAQSMAFSSPWVKSDNISARLIGSGTNLAIEVKLYNNWKSFWKYAGDVGIAPIIIVKSDNTTLDYKVFYDIPEIYKKANLISYIYKNSFFLPIDIRTTTDIEKIKIDINLILGMCKNTCKLNEINLSALINIHERDVINLAKINAIKDKIKQYNDIFKQIKIKKNALGDLKKIIIKTKRKLSYPNILITDHNNEFIDTPKFSLHNNILKIVPTKKLSSKQINLIITDSNDVYEKSLIINKVPKTEKDTLQIYLIAIGCGIIGGFILNLMPCVLPILSIKILSLIKLRGSKNFRGNVVSLICGIFFAFVLLSSLIITLKAIGSNVGFGFQFQQPIFLITVIIILTFAGTSLLEDHKISLSNKLTNLFHFKASDKTLAGNFVIGCFSTVVATSCTAPGLTTALSFILTANSIEIIIVFLAIAFGYALPYFALLLYPNILNLLPKPGAWMLNLSKIIAIAIFLSVLWFLYNLHIQLSLAATLVVFMLALLLKFIIKNWQKTENKYIKYPFIVILLCSFYIVPLKLAANDEKANIIQEKFWQPLNIDKIDSLIKEHKIVIVDITAEWCISCKINQLLTLNNANFINYMIKNNIIGMRADISKATPSKIATFMHSFNKNVIPFTVIYTKQYPKGQILPILLTQYEIKNIINKKV